MKTRLNLTIEESLLKQIKDYAQSRRRSISDLVEDYFKTVSAPKKKETLIDIVDSLPKPKLDSNINFKQEYYESKAKKYGF